VVFVTQLAVDYRNTFHKDIVIDLVCYRRRGHNEADEPAMTQPVMYTKIRSHRSTLDLYIDQLVAEQVVTQADADLLSTQYRDALDQGEHVAKSLVKEPNTSLFVDWSPYLDQPLVDDFDTSMPLSDLQEIGRQMNVVPEGFPLQKQIQKIISDRDKMTAGAMPINWGYAEVLAYATLLKAGHPIRLVGQDSGRGTFAHRHSVLHNAKDGSQWIPLKNLSSEQPNFQVFDSFLSEEAVLAFEYGYASTRPNTLTIWEAQFGDFANGAQVVIDQFITSGEHKWGRLCGLVLLLPHGYEGQGPEHSSARLERYLQLCAEQNIQVCVPTTPAQVYHMIRRQMLRNSRKPLVVMTPKSLLRHKLASSDLESLANGRFQTVIGETNPEIKPELVQRIVLCSGKVYYDLTEHRRTEQIDNVAIIRIEQLYPFPEKVLEEVLSVYVNCEDVVWCQEEPMNQGAWYSSQHHMRKVIARLNPDNDLGFAGRPASASPAAGYMKLHLEQLKQLLEDALVYPKK
jgi:2-oxoglutarate dehydrogenase E1 component